MPDLRARSTQLLLTAIGAAALIAGWLVRSRDADDQARSRLEAALGAVRLSLEAPRVQLYPRDETAVPLESFRGRVVFVNFWATWCGPCRAEMASLIALHATLNPDDIAFVSIAEDDTWPPVDAYLARSPLPFYVFRDRPPRVEVPFETGSYPTSFVIDRAGRAVYRFNGARDWNTPEVRELLGLQGVRAAHP